MARASFPLIRAIRTAAKKLETSDQYQWGHMGSCNCGFLAQEITRFTKDEIHRRAMMHYGDWSEQLNHYCPVNGLPINDVISELIEFGFDIDDLKHLERLSDGRVLCALASDERDLKHNVKCDVVKYMKTWADLLEDSLLKDVEVPEFDEALIS